MVKRARKPKTKEQEDLKNYRKACPRHVVTFEADMDEDAKRHAFSIASDLRMCGNEVAAKMNRRIDQLHRTRRYRKLLKNYGWYREQLKTLAKNEDTYKEYSLKLKAISKELEEMQKTYGVTFESVRTFAAAAGSAYGLNRKKEDEMNILHLKYVVSIAENGSINKAAEEMHVAQPNLSRVVKEMEADLGIQFFRRSSKGMRLTPDGELFVNQAKKILEQVDDMERLYKEKKAKKLRFSISVPRASYISDAFAAFSKTLGREDMEIFYHETNSLQAVKNILEVGYNLGIIRYAADYDKYFRQMLLEKGLKGELVAEFKYVLIMREDSPLAAKDIIHFSDLNPYIQIAHADPYVPSLPLSAVRNEELPQVPRRIFVFERGSQLDLLSENPETFMWVSSLPERLLQTLHLVQRECVDNQRVYRDVLIHRQDVPLSEWDKRFITELTLAKRACLSKKK